MTARTLTHTACLLATLTAVSLPAGQNFGVVSIAGNKAVTQDTLDWANANFPLTALLATMGGDSTGWFSNLDSTTTTIDDLNHAFAPARSDFGPEVSIGSDADSAMPTLGIDCIFDGIYPASGCSATPSTSGETCTPGLLVTPNDSPLSLVSDPGASCIPPIQTTATWVLAAAASDGGTRQGNLGATFDEPFQTRSVLPSRPSITGAFAIIITATAKLEPEGGYMLGSGLGLILLSVGSGRLFGKHHTK
jgi:hypothetical protein